jgi:hypothetical protein
MDMSTSYFPRRLAAALFAISFRRCADNVLVRAVPPSFQAALGTAGEASSQSSGLSPVPIRPRRCLTLGIYPSESGMPQP